MKYIVASLDVLNEGDGSWGINDVHRMGVININGLVLDDDQLILDILNECGYTNDLTVEDVEIDGDGEVLTITDFESGRPLYQLIFETY